MLEVETNHQIILLFFKEGLSIRSISKKLKINRRTVSIRIREYEQFKAAPISDQDNPGSLLNEYLKKGTVYKTDNRVKRLSLIHISEPTRQAEISYAVF